VGEEVRLGSREDDYEHGRRSWYRSVGLYF